MPQKRIANSQQRTFRLQIRNSWELQIRNKELSDNISERAGLVIRKPIVNCLRIYNPIPQISYASKANCKFATKNFQITNPK